MYNPDRFAVRCTRSSTISCVFQLSHCPICRQ